MSQNLHNPCLSQGVLRGSHTLSEAVSVWGVGQLSRVSDSNGAGAVEDERMFRNLKYTPLYPLFQASKHHIHLVLCFQGFCQCDFCEKIHHPYDPQRYRRNAA